MAKMKKCEICGKELPGGFWNGPEVIYFNSFGVDMCDECYEKYQGYGKDFVKRVEVKLDNKEKFSKKATRDELIKLIKDMSERIEEKCDWFEKEDFSQNWMDCFSADDEGNFIVVESSFGLGDKDVDWNDLIKRSEKNDVYDGMVYTKEDITQKKIYYTRSFMAKQNFNVKNFVGQSYTIMLGDPSKLSLKPGIVTATVLLGNCRRGGFTANKVLDPIFEQQLKAFFNHIGIDVEIERVKDFKKVVL